MPAESFDLIVKIIYIVASVLISGAVGLYTGASIERFKRKERYREKAYDTMVEAASTLFHHIRMAVIAGNHFSDNVNDQMWRKKFVDSLNNLQLVLPAGAMFQEEETFLRAVKIFDLLDNFYNSPESKYPSNEIEHEMGQYFQLLANKIGLRRLTKDLDKIFETRCQRYKRYWLGTIKFSCHPIKTSKEWIEENCRK